MTKDTQELNLEALEKASGGRGWGGIAAIIAHMKAVPAVPQYLSLAVMRPWFK